MLEVVPSAIDSVDEIDGHIGRCIARRREFLNITYERPSPVGWAVSLVWSRGSKRVNAELIQGCYWIYRNCRAYPLWIVFDKNAPCRQLGEEFVA